MKPPTKTTACKGMSDNWKDQGSIAIPSHGQRSWRHGKNRLQSEPSPSTGQQCRHWNPNRLRAGALENHPGRSRSSDHPRCTLLSRQGTITTSLRSMVGSNRNTHSTCLQAQPFLRCDHPLPFQVLKRLIKTQRWLRKRGRDIDSENQCSTRTGMGNSP